MDKQMILKEFQKMPGVGISIANDLWNMGFRSINELKDQNPEELYDRFSQQMGTHVDRCMLYVFRCIVYFASNERHDPELLKWWKWKEKK